MLKALAGAFPDVMFCLPVASLPHRQRIFSLYQTSAASVVRG